MQVINKITDQLDCFGIPFRAGTIDADSCFMNSTPLRKTVLTAFLSVACACVSSAATIDFEGAGGLNALSTGSYFDVDGFRFTNTGGVNNFVLTTSQTNLIETNSTKIFSANQSTFTMTKVGGGNFSVSSLDIGGSWADANLFYRWADTVEVSDGTNSVIASLAGQGTSYLNLALNFANVSYLSFSATQNVLVPGDNNFEFTVDNIVVGDAVATPDGGSTFALIGAAMAGLMMLRRNRTRLV